jgi:hypothetical protein
LSGLPRTGSETVAADGGGLVGLIRWRGRA